MLFRLVMRSIFLVRIVLPMFFWYSGYRYALNVVFCYMILECFVLCTALNVVFIDDYVFSVTIKHVFGALCAFLGIT